jgi:foldase protein PrsA
MKRFLLLAVLLFATAGCGDLLEPAAAVVKGKKITVEEVQKAVDDFVATDAFRQQAAQGDETAIKRGFEQGYLSQLIQRAVLEPEAEERGVAVSDADVEERMAQIAADFPSQSAFEEAVKEQGLTLAQLEELVFDQLLQERLRAEVTAEFAPTEAELLANYEENSSDFTQTRAQHILVNERSLAAELAERLQAASRKKVEPLFDRLARQHSTDEGNANQGGDLGFASRGDFVPAFDRAMAALEIGEVSDPVRTEFGFHVIRVIDRRVQPFEEVRDQIESEIAGSVQEQAWTDWLLAAFRAADVEVNPRYGDFDLESQQVVDPSAESLPGADIPEREPAESEAGD